MGLGSVLGRAVLLGAVGAPFAGSGAPAPEPTVGYVRVGRQPADVPSGVGYARNVVSRRGATVLVTCREHLDHPHWSREGRTVVFKTRVACIGNLPTIHVRITTLMGRMTDRGMVLVAGSLEDRHVEVDGGWSEPFSTPKKHAKKVRRSGRYRGEATLEIIESGGVKTSPVYMQTPIEPVTVP